jgi:uncharacterized membrane protein YfbV (UPF0208 family)
LRLFFKYSNFFNVLAVVGQLGMLSKLKDGQIYMDLWPMRKELSPLFPERRIIKATRFGIRVMPAVAAISVLTQLTFQNAAALPQSIVVALFAISLPIQGFWWLGTRSKTQLPPALAIWYREIHQKIIESGVAMEPAKSKPRYKELAQLLNRAFRQLDKNVLERWF